MSIHVGMNPAVLCRGDYRPAALYKGKQFIGGAQRCEPVAVPGSIEGTYNDTVEVAAFGRGRQDGIPAPDNPLSLIPAEAAVTSGDSTIQIPTLRAIPDGNGDWAARDRLTPVPYQPGWYEVRREVGIKSLTSSAGHIWGFTDDSKSGFFSCNIFKDKMTGLPKNTIALMCDTYGCTHYDGGIGSIWNIRDNDDIVNVCAMNYATDAYDLIIKDGSIAKLAEFNAWLREHPITVWYLLAAPTTERIYLGPLKSYPHLTTLTMTGDYPPEVTATAMTTT